MEEDIKKSKNETINSKPACRQAGKNEPRKTKPNPEPKTLNLELNFS